MRGTSTSRRAPALSTLILSATPTRLPESDPRYSGEHRGQTTQYSLAKDPEKIVTGAALDAIVVPGVLIQGSSHLTLPVPSCPLKRDQLQPF